MNVSNYTIKSSLNLKIALVSDLHERKPDQVLEKLRQIQPDIICVAGDMLERTDIGKDPRDKSDYSNLQHKLHSCMHALNNLTFFILRSEGNPNSENTYTFFKECQSIAPVFYSLGNHEFYLNERDKEILDQYNVTLLDNQQVEYNGIHIAGLSSNVDFDLLDSFEQQEGFKILLCHHPEYYDKYLKNRNIDCILSGHAHGGQIRLMNRGFFSPNQGFLPKYTKGKYQNLIVSAGCSNTAAIPRINNPCEVVVIDVKK